jgi:LPPG:FO 2-phospho-L-lactate transferase
MISAPKIVVLSGGVGGAKFADGLYRVLPKGLLTVIVNTGDDFSAFGLAISPDVDTVCYALAEIANPDTGWGQANESWNALESIKRLDGPIWFKLGDKDLGTHLERTRMLSEGFSLSEVIIRFCSKWKIQARVLPMSNQPVHTMVKTSEYGKIPFQEYFVAKNCEPRVIGFAFEGINNAQPAPGLLDEIRKADAVLIAPSNPLVSINPILAIQGVSDEIRKKDKVIAVSPIIGGKTIKGPLGKMYSELGKEPSTVTVADGYRGIITGYIMDKFDSTLEKQVSQWDIITMLTDTVMKSITDRVSLAEQTLAFLDREFSR